MNTPQPDQPDQPGGIPTPGEPEAAPQAQNATQEEVARFVTTIKNADQQVGEHVIKALQHDDTVAVLTTVVVGPAGQQHIVSAALNPSQAAVINGLLQSASEERVEEKVCFGFHCLVEPKDASEESKEAEAPPAQQPSVQPQEKPPQEDEQGA